VMCNYQEFAPLFGGKACDVDGSEAVFCRLDKEHSSMLSENQSLRAGSLPLIFHSGIIGRGLRAATDTAADVLSQNSVSSLIACPMKLHYFSVLITTFEL